jgi:transposase
MLIEEIVSEELELIPKEIIIKRTIREKYVLKDETFIVAPLPERAIYKGIAGTMLVSWLIVSKFVDHLPVYRIREILLRQRGIEHLPLSTMYDWISSVGTKMAKLFEVLRREVTSQSYRQMDETHIKVLFEGEKNKPLMGYFWVSLSIQAKGAIFDYHPTRGNKGVIDLLKDFKGDLQTDGYKVYQEYGKIPGITHYVCWAHARRKFVEALKNDKMKAEQALNLIGSLYAIESTAREQGLSHAQRLRLRKRDSIDILNQIKSLLDQFLPVTTPKSPIGAAVRYSLDRWQELINYANTGHVEIDNNLIENKIRPVALGRKNYLFVCTNESATKNGMWYSFAATCKMNDVDFMDWLYFVLPKLDVWPDGRLIELLPANYKNIEGYTPATEATRMLVENLSGQYAQKLVESK